MNNQFPTKWDVIVAGNGATGSSPSSIVGVECELTCAHHQESQPPMYVTGGKVGVDKVWE